MYLKFPENAIMRGYEIKYLEEISPFNGETMLSDRKLDIKFEYNKNKIILYIESEVVEDQGLINEILNKTNKALDVIMYELDSNGKISKLENYIEILNKWKEIKKELDENDFSENIEDFIFEMNSCFTTREVLEEMLKRYNIFPLVFLGLYNKEIEFLRLESTLYNVYPLDNIPVIYELEDASTEEELCLNFRGKPKTEFERYKYLGKIKKDLEMESVTDSTIDINFEGNFKFHKDGTLKMYEMEIRVKSPGIVNYSCKYEILEKE